MQEEQWDSATHGYRWVDYQDAPMAEEQAYLQKAIGIHTRVSGKRPVGNYVGRTNPNSARICALEGGYLNDATSYAGVCPTTLSRRASIMGMKATASSWCPTHWM